MTNQEQAFAEGFVKRASEYGFTEDQALEIYKQAMGEMPLAGKKLPVNPPVKFPSNIKGNANDVANKPSPLKPLRPEDMY